MIKERKIATTKKSLDYESCFIQFLVNNYFITFKLMAANFVAVV